MPSGGASTLAEYEAFRNPLSQRYPCSVQEEEEEFKFDVVRHYFSGLFFWVALPVSLALQHTTHPARNHRKVRRIYSHRLLGRPSEPECRTKPAFSLILFYFLSDAMLCCFVVLLFHLFPFSSLFTNASGDRSSITRARYVPVLHPWVYPRACHDISWGCVGIGLLHTTQTAKPVFLSGPGIGMALQAPRPCISALPFRQ